MQIFTERILSRTCQRCKHNSILNLIPVPPGLYKKASFFCLRVGGMPHLPGFSHLHVNRPLKSTRQLWPFGVENLETCCVSLGWDIHGIHPGRYVGHYSINVLPVYRLAINPELTASSPICRLNVHRCRPTYPP